MESTMRKTILTGVAALALASLPALAQEADADVAVTLTTEGPVLMLRRVEPGEPRRGRLGRGDFGGRGGVAHL